MHMLPVLEQKFVGVSTLGRDTNSWSTSIESHGCVFMDDCGYHQVIIVICPVAH